MRINELHKNSAQNSAQKCQKQEVLRGVKSAETRVATYGAKITFLSLNV